MKLNTEAIRNAFEILSKVPLRSGIECSEFVKMVAHKGALRLYLSSDMVGEVEVGLADEENWTFFAQRNTLLPFIKAAKVKELDVTVATKGDGTQQKTTMTIVDGRRRATFQDTGKTIGGYVEVDKKIPGEKKIVLSDEHRQRVQLAAKYATFDSMNPQLNCVFFAKRGLMTSNSYSIFVSEDALPFEGPFPLELIDLLSVKSKLYVHKNGARLEFPGGWIYCAVRDRCIKGFPQKRIAAAIDDGKKLPVVFEAKILVFKQTVDRLYSYVQSEANIDVTMHITGKKGESDLKLVTATTHASFSDKLKLTAPLKADLKAEMMLHEVYTLLRELEGTDEKLIVRTAETSWYYLSVPSKKLQVITSRIAPAAK